ncbi:RNA polymerase factor sigma-54 [Marinilactibacillus kalidii]|uniref:RNA polymerase factor sigma-54 n=1 Tax=Marinilactibacillus kalidii TaxID=2820274 RepID=UPI001ABE458B|nr:RNA polymerase factor sigma-54 [Marinilactibacillus kalidii]
MDLNQHLNLSQRQQLSPVLLQRIQMLSFNQEDLLSFLNKTALENPFIEVNIPYTSSHSISGEQDMSWIPDNKTSLRDYLIEQVLLTYRDTLIREMIFWWINQLDQKGYVKQSLEGAIAETKVDETLLLDALVLLQQLEPAGIAARSLQESLMLQTERDENAPETAYIILEESFEALVDRKWQSIAEQYRISLQDVQTVFDYIKRLDPAPGERFQTSLDMTIRPDLIVQIENEQLIVQEAKLNTPLLSFDQAYVTELSQTKDEEVTAYVKEKKQEYDALQTSLQQRNQTILRVGTAIVNKQKDFFFDQTRPLKPLQLKELAENLDLHESTISRTVNGKFIQTATGTYEFKFFLSRSLSNENEETLSTHSVQQKLKKLVDQENKAKPLSDQKIVDLLAQDNIHISRRAVTKYRKQLNIPASSKRKRFDS